MTRLADVDPAERIASRKEAEKRLKEAQARLVSGRLTLGGQLGVPIGPPLCVVFEGWDASGKGGAIKRLVEPLDPRHVRVVQFGAPTYDEKRHHFLGRFWPILPGRGGMVVLDRSWYGRVLVERVERFATVAEWSRAYDEIRDFERSLVEDGTILVKFWMHISDAEQLRRFDGRAEDPLRRWKLTDEDWRNRERRGDYEDAVENMLERTDTTAAPWVVVPSDHKPSARTFVVEHVSDAIEKALGRSARSAGS